MEESSDLQCNSYQSNSDSPPMSFGTLSGGTQDHNNIPQNCLTLGDLRSICEIPHKYRHIFLQYPTFNIIQSKVLDDVFYSDAPVVVSAPTGSGKTVIFEMAIVRLLSKIEELSYRGDFKIVYLAPVKALCAERCADWQVKFGPHGVDCQELTGDTWETDLSEVGASRLLLTTPEKWDSLTRRWRDKEKLVQVVKLFLIDEVHLLNEEQRGPTLEVVVSRMKTVQKTLNFERKSSPQLSLYIRFIAVSATIPNIEDIAQWLANETIAARYHKVSDELRPVKLNKVVVGYPRSSPSAFQFDISLSYKIRPLLMKYAESKPTLIFCSTRKSVEHTSVTLAQQLTMGFSQEQQEYLRSTASTLLEGKLRELVPVGIGFHHAGMDPGDRQAVEWLFRQGLLPVLVTTSTLAMGVNLPAHLVIIKSTQQYAMGEYREYSETQVLQMIGRAGRPQFDTTASVVIMTREATKLRYEKLVEGKELVESSLHRHLPEHLNAEVVLKTICELSIAMDWIRSTFLYIRVMRNPKHYGFPSNLEKRGIERRLEEMCLRELHELSNAKLITLNVYDVSPTDTGQLMARYYIAFESMKMFGKVCGMENLPQMLELISKCREFHDIQLRVNEKRTLNALNSGKDKDKSIRYTLPGTIKTRDMKVNCLVQAAFGCLPVTEISLTQDTMKIMRIGERLVKCLLQLKQVRQHFQSCLSALLLSKCFHRRLWENSPYVSRQFDRIGPNLSALLVAAGKTSFQALAESNPRDLERILNKPPPIGNRIQEMAKGMPKCTLDLQLKNSRPRDELIINVSLLNPENVPPDQQHGQESHTYCLLVGDSNNRILLHKRFKLHELVTAPLALSWRVMLHDSAANEIQAHLLNENWVGLDTSTTVNLTNTKQIQQSISKNLTKYLLLSQKQPTGKALTVKTKSAKPVSKNKSSSIAELIQKKKCALTPMPHLTLKTQNSSSLLQHKIGQFGYSPQRKSKLQAVKHQTDYLKNYHKNEDNILMNSSTNKSSNVSSVMLNEGKSAPQTNVSESVTCLQKQATPPQMTKKNIALTSEYNNTTKEANALEVMQTNNIKDIMETDHEAETVNDDESDNTFTAMMEIDLEALREAGQNEQKTIGTSCASPNCETNSNKVTKLQTVSVECKLTIAVDSNTNTLTYANFNNLSYEHSENKTSAVDQQETIHNFQTIPDIPGNRTKTNFHYLPTTKAHLGDFNCSHNTTQNDTEPNTEIPIALHQASELGKCKTNVNHYSGKFLNFDLGIDVLLDTNFLTDDDSENENSSKTDIQELVSDKLKVNAKNLCFSYVKAQNKVKRAPVLRDIPLLNSSSSNSSGTEEQPFAVQKSVSLQSSPEYFTLPSVHNKPASMSHGFSDTQLPNGTQSSTESRISQDMFTSHVGVQKYKTGNVTDCFNKTQCNSSCSKTQWNSSSSCNSDSSCCNSPSQVQFTSQFSPILKVHVHDDDFERSMDTTDSQSYTHFSPLWVSQQKTTIPTQLTDYYPVTKQHKKYPK